MAEFEATRDISQSDDDEPYYYCEECCEVSAQSRWHCPIHDDGPCTICGAMVPKGKSANADDVICTACMEEISQ
jgi:hypothetical protein